MKIKFLILFILLILGFGLWVYWKNIFSKEVLKFEIFGPDEAKIGQLVEYIVKYKNNGRFRLDDPELIFEAPENSLMEEGIFLRQTLGKERLGEAIYPGEEKIFSFKMRLFGREGEKKIARATLSFKPKGLKPRSELSTSYLTIIKEVPIAFDFDLPSQVPPEEKFKIILNYYSNVDYPLSDVRIKIDFPSGFEILNLEPKPFEENEWKIGVLNKLDGGRIEVEGKITGWVGEEKFFKANLISWQGNESILLKEALRGVNIVKPTLYIRQEINGNPDFKALPGDWLHYEIYFKNLGEKPLQNLFLINNLEGEAFDFSTIKSEFGIFREGEKAVIFDWRRVLKLQYLAPLDEGKVDFWIKLKDDLGMTKNPKIKNKIFLAQAIEEFETKIGSKIEILQKGYFSDEFGWNSGPLPPEVGKKTTYTIIWQVKNYYNDVKNLKIKASLPPEVELTGKIFPEEEKSRISFDPQSREIVWSIENLEAGKGVLNQPLVLAFQISFLPSEDQRGKSPDLISEAKITGQDTWTNQTLFASSPSINTTLPDDDTITEEMGIVK